MLGLFDRAGCGGKWHGWSELVTADEQIWRTKVFRKPTAHREQPVCRCQGSRCVDRPSQLGKVGVLGRTRYFWNPIPSCPSHFRVHVCLLGNGWCSTPWHQKASSTISVPENNRTVICPELEYKNSQSPDTPSSRPAEITIHQHCPLSTAPDTSPLSSAGVKGPLLCSPTLRRSAAASGSAVCFGLRDPRPER